MTKSKGVRLDSALGKAAADYALHCGPTKSYVTAFGDGGLHLLEVAEEQYADIKNDCEVRSDGGAQIYMEGAAEMLRALKSYCGRE